MQPATGSGKYERLLARCQGLEPVPTAVAHPCEGTALIGAIEAAQHGLIRPLLVGPAARIKETANAAGIDLGDLQIIDVPHSLASAAKAVELIREGKAEILMKGSLHTDELMASVVARDTGIRTQRRISHCFVMDVPGHLDPLIITDAAVNIAPTLEDKMHIVQNAIDLAHAVGYPEVRVAILSAMETVNPKNTVDGRGSGAVQDGGSRPDHRCVAGRAAGTRQCDLPRGGGDQAYRLAGRRSGQSAGGAGPRGGQHAGQEPVVPGRCRYRRHRAWRAGADHPD